MTSSQILLGPRNITVSRQMALLELNSQPAPSHATPPAFNALPGNMGSQSFHISSVHVRQSIAITRLGL